MSVTAWLLLLCGVILRAQNENSAPSLSLSLGEVLSRVERSNLDLLIGREDVEQANQQLRRDRSALFPQLTAEASQNRQQSFFGAGPFSNFGGEDALPDNMTFPSRAVFNTFSARLRAEVSLLDTQKIADFWLARLERDIAEYEYQQQVQDIQEIAVMRYFNHLRNLNRLQVIEANIARDKVLLQLALDRKEAQVATSLDVTRAEAALASDQRQRLEQNTLVEQSRLELLRIITENLGREISLRDHPINEAAASSHSLEELPAIVETRPEYQAALRLLRRNEVARKAAVYERLPTIDLLAEYGTASSIVLDDDSGGEWFLGATVTVPIFEGFRIDANQELTASAIRRQGHVLHDIRESIGLEYRLALTDLRNRFEQIRLARKSVELGEKELELAQAQFAEGVADNSEVVEAQANLAEASDVLVEAKHQYNLARLTLARVKGDVRLVLSN